MVLEAAWSDLSTGAVAGRRGHTPIFSNALHACGPDSGADLTGDVRLGFIFSALLRIAEPCNYSIGAGVKLIKTARAQT